MIAFLLFKALLLGGIWAAGLSLLLAYGLHFFPLPALFSIRDAIKRLAKGLEKKRPKYAQIAWQAQLWLSRIAAALIWIVAFGLYSGTNYYIFTHYFDSQNVYFLYYYFSSMLLPFCFWAWQAYRLLHIESRLAEQMKAERMPQ